MFLICDNIEKMYGEENFELVWRLRDDKEIEEYLYRKYVLILINLKVFLVWCIIMILKS